MRNGEKPGQEKRGCQEEKQAICKLEKSDYLSQGKELVSITPGHFQSLKECENGGVSWGSVPVGCVSLSWRNKDGNGIVFSLY